MPFYYPFNAVPKSTLESQSISSWLVSNASQTFLKFCYHATLFILDSFERQCVFWQVWLNVTVSKHALVHWIIFRPLIRHSYLTYKWEGHQPSPPFPILHSIIQTKQLWGCISPTRLIQYQSILSRFPLKGAVWHFFKWVKCKALPGRQ